MKRKVRENSDKKLVAQVRKDLREHHGYCPCALLQTEDTKCMCKDFRDKIENGYVGECNCGLYEVE